MSKKYIVKTPFGIGVATSDEDLKGLLSFVTGAPVSKEEIAEMLLGEDRMTQEEVDACDCENCQHNAEVSAMKIAALREFIALVDHPAPLNFMKKDLDREIYNASQTLGEDHPATKHLKEMLKVVEEHNANLSVPEDETGDEDCFYGTMHTSASMLIKDYPDAEAESKEEPLLTIEQVGGINSLEQLEREDNRVKELANSKGKQVDELVAELQNLGILREYLWGRKGELREQQAVTEKEDNPGTEGTDEGIPTKESIMAMSDYDAVDQLQISLEAEMSRLSDKKQEIVDEIHAEMKRVEDLHSVAASRKAELLENKADIAHADMADKVKALQEAITRSAPHLLIHEDIMEAMEILKERYRK